MPMGKPIWMVFTIRLPESRLSTKNLMKKKQPCHHSRVCINQKRTRIFIRPRTVKRLWKKNEIIWRQQQQNKRRSRKCPRKYSFGVGYWDIFLAGPLLDTTGLRSRSLRYISSHKTQNNVTLLFYKIIGERQNERKKRN